MKTLLLSLYLLILACGGKKPAEKNKAVLAEKESKIVDRIRDSIIKTDPKIRVSCDTGKNVLSIQQVKFLFSDTLVSAETFPWIAKISRCKINRTINTKPYTSYLYVFFTRDSLRDNEIDSFCVKTGIFERAMSTGFSQFYGGRDAIILHYMYIDRRENHIYADTLLFSVQSALEQCGYRSYNRELRNYDDQLPRPE